MTITIRIVAVAERAVDGKPARFSDEGGTIGRRSDSTLVIPDQSRRVSRVHAVVSRQGGLFKIRDQGSFLPVYVNGHGVGFQREMTLRPGDRIQIGPYTLEVAADAAFDATMAPTPAAVLDVPPAKAPAEDAPMTLAQVPFEILEKRLAAAKASGLRLTTDNYPIEPDATATQEKPFDGVRMPQSTAPDGPAEESSIDLEPVGSSIVRNLPDFPPPFSPADSARASNESAPDTLNPPSPQPAPSKPARVISLLETARRVLGGRN